jgi:hypothetical protein
MRTLSLVFSITFVASISTLQSVPPLESGDVLPADKESFELYVGMRYESEGASINRLIPSDEFVYGVWDRQEITLELPYASQDGHHGFGDVTVGTKYMFVKETRFLPGISSTFEWKLNNGSFPRGLGTGAFNYDFRAIGQKTWGHFSGLWNLGYTVIGEPEVNGISEKRKNVWFTSFAQEYELTSKLKWLSEIYLETADEPSTPNRLAADAGFEYKIREEFKVHGTIGKSIRQGSQGGPDLRFYVGFEWDFDAPWKHETKDKEK